MGKRVVQDSARRFCLGKLKHVSESGHTVSKRFKSECLAGGAYRGCSTCWSFTYVLIDLLLACLFYLFVYSYNLFMCKYHACMLYGFFAIKASRIWLQPALPRKISSQIRTARVCARSTGASFTRKISGLLLFPHRKQNGRQTFPRARARALDRTLPLSLSEAALDHHAA